MMPDDARPQSFVRRWVVPLAVMCAPWAIYVAVLSRQSVDALAAWRNDIFWPADHYLTVGLAGLVGPFLLYIGLGLGSGALLGIVLMLLAKGVRRALALSDFSTRAGPAAMVVMPALLFVFKAVPHVVTEVDAEARRLVVREFHWLLRCPTDTIEVEVAEISALDVVTQFHRGSGYDVIIHAETSRGAVRLGQRLCASEVEVCLKEGEAEMVEVARLLGATGTSRAGRDGHRVLVLDK